MGKVIIHNQVTVNGAFEAPTPEEWLELDPDSAEAGLEQLILADALLLGRTTYEGLAAVWPHLGEDPSIGHYAERVNGMPKYVASRTLAGPLLQLVAATPYRSGVVWLRYRPAGA